MGGALVILAIEVFVMWDSAFERETALLQTVSAILVMIFTLGLWVSTIIQAKHAKAAVDIALANFSLTKSGERAYIFVVPEVPSIDAWRMGKEDFIWSFSIHNHGKTPAVINSISAAVTIANRPPYLDYQRERSRDHDPFSTISEVRLLSDSRFILSHGTSSKTFALRGDRPPLHLGNASLSEQSRQRNLTWHALTSPASGQRFFWLRCIVNYEDVHGGSHSTSLCVSLDPGGKGWSPYDVDGYNSRT